MAAPVLRGAATSAKGATTGAPANPTGLATGDLDILIAVCSPGGTLAISANGGGAWSSLPTPLNAQLNVASGASIRAWYRIASVGVDAAPTVTGGGTALVTVTRIAYQTATFDASTPFEALNTYVETTSDTSFSMATGVSTTGVTREVVCAASVIADSNTGQVGAMANAALTSLASLINVCTNAGTTATSCGLGVTSGDLATAGSTGTFTVTYGTASPKAAITFAVRPVPPVAATIVLAAPAGASTVTGTVAVKQPLALQAGAGASTVSLTLTALVPAVPATVALDPTVGQSTAAVVVSRVGFSLQPNSQWPNTIGRVGPWTDASGNLWVIAYNASLQVSAFTSSDEGVNWSNAGAYTATAGGSGNAGSLDAQPDSRTTATYIDVLYQDSSHALNIIRFTIATTTWSLVSSGTQPVVNPDGVSRYPAFFARRSDGSYVVLYNGPLHNSTYRSCYYTITSTSGAWGAVAPTEFDLGGNYNFRACSVVLGASDRVHCLFYYARVGYYLHERNVDSANSLSTAARVDASPLGSDGYLYTLYYDPAVGLLVPPPSSGGSPFRGDSSAAPTWSVDTGNPGTDTPTWASMAFAYDPTGLYAWFVDTASTDIYRNATSGTTWTAADAAPEMVAGTSPRGLSTSGTRISPGTSGATGIGVCYSELGSTVFYGFFETARPVSATLALDASAGTSTVGGGNVVTVPSSVAATLALATPAGQSTATGIVSAPATLPLATAVGQSTATGQPFRGYLGAFTATAASTVVGTVSAPATLPLATAVGQSTATGQSFQGYLGAFAATGASTVAGTVSTLQPVALQTPTGQSAASGTLRFYLGAFAATGQGAVSGTVSRPEPIALQTPAGQGAASATLTFYLGAFSAAGQATAAGTVARPEAVALQAPAGQSTASGTLQFYLGAFTAAGQSAATGQPTVPGPAPLVLQVPAGQSTASTALRFYLGALQAAGASAAAGTVSVTQPVALQVPAGQATASATFTFYLGSFAGAGQSAASATITPPVVTGTPLPLATAAGQSATSLVLTPLGRRPGFPAEGSGTSRTALPFTTVAVGDTLMVGVRILTYGFTVTGVSGGGATGWAQVAEHPDASDSRYITVWTGTVNAVGAQTLTITYSSAPGVACEIIVDELSGVVATGASGATDYGGSAGTTITFPTLVTVASDGYWGYARCSNVPTLTGQSAGYSMFRTVQNDVVLLGVQVSGSQSPTCALNGAGNWDAIGVVLRTSLAQAVSLAAAVGQSTTTGTITAPTPAVVNLPLAAPAGQSAASAALLAPAVSFAVATGSLTHARVQGAPAAHSAVTQRSRGQGGPAVAHVVPASLSLSASGESTASAVITPPTRVGVAGLVHFGRALGETALRLGEWPVRRLGAIAVSSIGATRPLGLAHRRTQGHPAVKGHLTIETPGLAHKRVVGAQVVYVPARPASLEHARALGTIDVNVRELQVAALQHERGQGTIIVVLVKCAYPHGIAHKRGQGLPAARGLWITTIRSLAPSRALGAPAVKTPVHLPALTHDRGLGEIDVNVLEIMVLALART